MYIHDIYVQMCVCVRARARARVYLSTDMPAGPSILEDQVPAEQADPNGGFADAYAEHVHGAYQEAIWRRWRICGACSQAIDHGHYRQ